MTGPGRAAPPAGAGEPRDAGETSDQNEEPGDGAAEPARVRVVRGEPDDLELAALVAGLVAVSGGFPDDAAPPAPSAWTDRSRELGRAQLPTPGPAAWRWSQHP